MSTPPLFPFLPLLGFFSPSFTPPKQDFLLLLFPDWKTPHFSSLVLFPEGPEKGDILTVFLSSVFQRLNNVSFFPTHFTAPFPLPKDFLSFSDPGHFFPYFRKYNVNPPLIPSLIFGKRLFFLMKIGRFISPHPLSLSVKRAASFFCPMRIFAPFA